MDTEQKKAWVLLHIRNGEDIIGLVPMARDGARDHQAAEQIMTVFDGCKDNSEIIEVENPNQMFSQMDGHQKAIITMPLSHGDKRIFLRVSEILYVQFMDENGAIVSNIRAKDSKIAIPKPSTGRPGGIIIPRGNA